MNIVNLNVERIHHFNVHFVQNGVMLKDIYVNIYYPANLIPAIKRKNYFILKFKGYILTIFIILCRFLCFDCVFH